ncbi:MAG TPA: hypothetical protein VH393_04270 [Ktedonobacterales bacterium]|jgi:excisionase family DNA binding protein
MTLRKSHEVPQQHKRREPPAIPPTLLGLEAAGAYLGLSRSTIIKMLAEPEPELRSIVYRHRRLIPRGELDAWMRRTFEAEHGEEPPDAA